MRLYRPAEASSPPGILELDWRRTANGTSASSGTTKTYIPLPAFVLPSESGILVEPLVTCSLPSRVILHQPFRATFRLTRPLSDPDPFSITPRIVSFQMESATDSFVFSGPRIIDRLLLQQSESQEAEGADLLAEYMIVPIGRTGLVELPRFRVWEVLDKPAPEEEGNMTLGHEHPGSNIRELDVIRENTLDMLLEGRQEERSLTVFVVPR